MTCSQLNIEHVYDNVEYYLLTNRSISKVQSYEQGILRAGHIKLLKMFEPRLLLWPQFPRRPAERTLLTLTNTLMSR